VLNVDELELDEVELVLDNELELELELELDEVELVLDVVEDVVLDVV